MAKDKDKGKDKDAKPRQEAQQQPKAPKKEAPRKEAASAPPKATGPQLPAPPARLALQYRDKIVPDLMKKFGYKTVMQVPRIKKITINMGVGESVNDKKVLDHAVADMTRIAGQKPVVTKTRKSIANFKVRAGYPVGCMVTLRGARMYEFLDRLVSVGLPRVRDFRGVSPKAFDGRGNYTIGVREQLIFPEIDFNKVDKTRGMNISIVTTARDDEQARSLLKALGMPFRQQGT